jgi:hemolysin III
MIQKLRDPVSGLTHLFSAIAAIVGLVYLLSRGWGYPTREISFLIYGLSLILLFSASATYHLVNAEPRLLGILRKVDHTSIYVLIAGSYTPICLNFFRGFWQVGLLAIIWTLALVGVGVKVFVIKAPRWVTAGVYLVMGWLCIMAIGEMLATMPADALIWLLAGGLFYTVGAVLYITKWPDPFPNVFGFHEIWHIFVMLGAASHFIVVASYIAK